MAKLSAQEIYQIARQAGFSPDQAVTMTAIALAESGGNTRAHNPKGEDSRGLWQINMRAHASWVNQMGLDLWDPLDNAKAAFRVSGGGANISPWTVTHRSKGAPYTRYQQEAIAAARAAGENASGVFSGSGGYGTTTAAGGGGGSVFQAAGGSSGIGPTEAQPNESPEDYARRVYGMGAAWLDHPEVGPILKRAAAEGWSKDRLEGALSATDWWVQTTQSKRQWDALKSSDPNEAESRIGERIAVLEDIAQELGLRLSPEQIRLVAENSLQWGWNDAQVRNALGAEAVKDPASLAALTESNTATKLRAIARDFAFPLSDAAVQTWMKAIVQGTRTEDDFLAYAREQAKMLFPTIAGAIDAGIAPSQYFDPYRQIAARTLSLNPEQIDLSDPKWMSALAVTDEQGNRVPMRLDQWEAHIKSDERYGYHLTQQADREAEALVDFVGRMFGKVA